MKIKTRLRPLYFVDDPGGEGGDGGDGGNEGGASGGSVLNGGKNKSQPLTSGTISKKSSKFSKAKATLKNSTC